MFTKREERDEDGGLRLANVIATSDVNSTEYQSESFKRDIVKTESDESDMQSQKEDTEMNDTTGYASDLNSTEDQSESLKGDVMTYETNGTNVQSQEEDPGMNDTTGSGSGDELFDEKDSSNREFGFTKDKFEEYSQPGFESELGAGSNGLRSTVLKQDESSTFGSGPSHDSESENGSRFSPELDSDNDPGVESDSNSASNSDAHKEMEIGAGSAEEDFMETSVSDEGGEKNTDGKMNTNARNSQNNSTAMVGDGNTDETTFSQETGKPFSSEKKNFSKSENVDIEEFSNNHAFLNTSENNYKKYLSQNKSIGKINQVENTDASNHPILENTLKNKQQFTSEERNSSNNKGDDSGTSNINNHIYENLSADNAKKFSLNDNNVENNIPEMNAGMMSDQMFLNPYINPLENGNNKLESNDNTDTENDQDFTDLPDNSHQQFEADFNILGQDKQDENTSLSGDQVSLNSLQKSNNQVESYEENPGRNNVYENIDLTLSDSSENSPDYGDKQFVGEIDSFGKNTKAENKNTGRVEWNFEKQRAKFSDNSQRTKYKSTLSSDTVDQDDATADAQRNSGNIGGESQGRENYRYWLPNDREYTNDYYNNVGNNNQYGYEDSYVRERGRDELAKRDSIPKVVGKCSNELI